mmetsp:Transcript_31811/g.75585  ORF Transcript_31811/g.75585 Transcript_31811/m.75585 type:complete len:672 (-) Transcript_31811:107-2122(-)
MYPLLKDLKDPSLPLGGARRLGGEVEDDAGDAGDRLDLRHHVVERLERKVLARDRGLAGHEVARDERPDRNRAVAGNAERRGEENNRDLGEGVLEAVVEHERRDARVGQAQLVHRRLVAVGLGHALDARRRGVDRRAPHEARPRDRHHLSGDRAGDGEEGRPVHLLGRFTPGGEGEGDGRLVRAAVALDADSADRQLHKRELRLGVQLHALRNLSEVRGGEAGWDDAVRAQHADRQPGAREGLAPDEVLGEPERRAELAHLILVEVAKRLDDLALGAELAHEGRVVVVRLDHVRLGRRQVGAALDEVRAQRALRQVDAVRIELEVAHSRLRHAHERVSDDHPLVLGGRGGDERAGELPADVGRGLGEGVRAPHHLQVDPDLAERSLNGVALVLAHEAVVDVHRVHPVGADSLAAERGTHRGVHATRHKHQHLLVADNSADLIERGLVAGDGGEGALELGDFEEEVLEDSRAVLREVHLGVELGAEELAVRVLDRHDRAVRPPNRPEPRGHTRHGVAVGEEALLRRGRPRHELRRHVNVHRLLKVFAARGFLNPAPLSEVEELVAVADAEDGQAHVEHRGVEGRRVCLVARPGAARDDDRAVLAAELLGGRVERKHVRLHREFADAAVDELAVLSTRVEDRDLLRLSGALLRLKPPPCGGGRDGGGGGQHRQ